MEGVGLATFKYVLMGRKCCYVYSNNALTSAPLTATFTLVRFTTPLVAMIPLSLSPAATGGAAILVATAVSGLSVRPPVLPLPSAFAVPALCRPLISPRTRRRRERILFDWLALWCARRPRHPRRFGGRSAAAHSSRHVVLFSMSCFVKVVFDLVMILGLSFDTKF